MKKQIFLLIVFAILLIPSSVLAKEYDSCELYEQGTETLLKEDLDEYKNMINKKISYLNKYENDNLNSITYTYEVQNVKTEQKKQEFKETTVKTDQNFATEQQALDYFYNVPEETNYVFKNPVVTKKLVTTINNGQEVTIKCKSLNCLTEIQNIEELVNDNEIYVELKVDNTTTLIVTEEKKEYDEIFSTQEEAEVFANNHTYMEGLTFVKNEIVTTTFLDKIEETYDKMFSTKEEAQQALENFKAQHSNVEGQIDKVRDQSKEQTVTDSKNFATREEAENWIDANTPETGKGIITSSIKGPQTIKEDEQVINEEYTNEAEAQQRINKLQLEGYKTDNLKIEENITQSMVTNVGDIDTEYKQNAPYTPVSITNVDYILIKQGHQDIVIWTPTPMMENQQILFMQTLKDESIKDQNPIFISGYETFNLHELTGEKNWGTYYNFSQEGENTILKFEDGKISHITYGNFKTSTTISNKYQLTGTIYKTKEVYTASYEKVDYVYAYKVTAKATDQVEKTGYKVISTFQKQTPVTIYSLTYRIDTKAQKEVYNLEYDKWRIETYELVSFDWRISKCSRAIGSTTENSGTDDNTTNEIEPPKTGIESNNSYQFILIIILILSSITLIKTVKE